MKLRISESYLLSGNSPSRRLGQEAAPYCGEGATGSAQHSACEQAQCLPAAGESGTTAASQAMLYRSNAKQFYSSRRSVTFELLNWPRIMRSPVVKHNTGDFLNHRRVFLGIALASVKHRGNVWKCNTDLIAQQTRRETVTGCGSIRYLMQAILSFCPLPL